MTAHVIFEGFVQGVGFRSFVKSIANQNKVNGWVTNLPNGLVEAIFQATSKETIQKVIDECKAYMFADIKNVKIEWKEQSQEYKTFEIVK